MQIKLQARPASGLLVRWINCVAVAASGHIILNVWHPIVRSSSNKTQQQEEERVWGGIEWHSLCEFWLLHPAVFMHTHVCLTADERVALPGKWGSMHMLLVSLQVAFPALLLLQAQWCPQWPHCCTLWWVGTGRPSWRSHGGPSGRISKAFSHGLPCYRTSLYPWQVYSTIKPTRDLHDHLDYKSASLIHLVLS